MRFSKIVFAFSALAVNLCSILAHPVQVEEPLNTGIIPRNITSTNFANVNVRGLLCFPPGPYPVAHNLALNDDLLDLFAAGSAPAHFLVGSGPGKCEIAACHGGDAVKVCNDNTYPIEPFYQDILGHAQNIWYHYQRPETDLQANILYGDTQLQGQEFDTEGWNVLIEGKQKCG